MVEEILMDVVQQSHKEIARTRTVCDVCHTRCVPVLPCVVRVPVLVLTRAAATAQMRSRCVSRVLALQVQRTMLSGLCIGLFSARARPVECEREQLEGAYPDD